MNLRFRFIIPLFTLALLSGCSMFSSVGDMWHQSMRAMKPGTGDYDDNTDETDEGWIKEAGIEARGDRPIEYENDPFRVLMSPKAKSIEKNLGIQ